MNIAHSHQDVTIRYAGDHATKVRALPDQRAIEVTIPGVTITITSSVVAQSIWRLWYQAGRLAARIYSSTSAATYPAPRMTRTTTRIEIVRLPDGDTGRQIWAKVPKHSASGCGEMRVRIGELTIICDDRAAFDRQMATWAMVADIARRSDWLRRSA